MISRCMCCDKFVDSDSFHWVSWTSAECDAKVCHKCKSAMDQLRVRDMDDLPHITYPDTTWDDDYEGGWPFVMPGN